MEKFLENEITNDSSDLDSDVLMKMFNTTLRNLMMQAKCAKFWTKILNRNFVDTILQHISSAF